MAKYKYIAKPGAPSSTLTPVWAEEVTTRRDVKVGKLRSGADKIEQAKMGDVVYTVDLHGNYGKVMPKSEFDALYDRMP